MFETGFRLHKNDTKPKLNVKCDCLSHLVLDYIRMIPSQNKYFKRKLNELVLDYIRMIPSQNELHTHNQQPHVLDYIRMIPSQNYSKNITK